MSARTIIKDGIFKLDIAGTIGVATNELQLKTNNGIIFADGTIQTSAGGSTGATGPAGATGAQGATGATGPQGQDGTASFTGATGSQGPTGPNGAQGEKGDMGDTGATGPKGETGYTGDTGPTGANGVNGVDGPTGPTGSIGETGPTGSAGPLVGLQEIVNVSGGLNNYSGNTAQIGFYTAGSQIEINPYQVDIFNTALSLRNVVRPDEITLRDDPNNAQVQIYTTSSTISDNNYSHRSISSTHTIEKLNTTAKTILDSSSLSLTDENGDVAVLTATDLTFDGLSINDIFTFLKIKQTNTILQNISPAIYADGKAPTAPTSTIINTYGFTPSWYMKNTVASQKINWYIGPNINMTVADVLGLYMYYFNGLTTSNDNTAFFVIYTKPQTGDPTWYRSKRVYIFDQTVTPVANTRYCPFANLSGNCPTPPHYGFTLNNMGLSPVAGSNVGPFAPDEEILAFSIQSNSASAINTVEFCVSKIGIMTYSGTQEFLFIPQ